MEKEKKPVYKKWWFWVIVVVVLLIIGSMGSSNTTQTSSNSVNESTSNNSVSSKAKVTVVDFSAMEKEAIINWCTTNNVKYNFVDEYSDTVEKGKFVSQSATANSTINEGDTIKIAYSLGKEPSTEYKNALKKAETYSESMHMSKKAIYEQLTSSYGEGFDKDAAQYAVDNLQADYNENALKKAKTYQSSMSMSKSAIYDQLVSDYGEKFTKSEAQYAIDHLE